MFVRRKAFVAVEVLQVTAWVITSDFYLHDTSQIERAQSWIGAWSTAGWNEGCKIGLRVTLAVKGDGRPASILPLSSWPSGSAQALYNVCVPALAKQIATNFNCLCIHLLTPNALQPHPPILLSSPAQMKEREARDGGREKASIITYFSGLL